MKKQRKKITMDVLAGMVQRGFLDTNKRFDGVDKRLNKVDEHLDKVDERLNKIEKDVADLKEDFHKILDALDKVAKHYDDYLKEVTARDAEVKRMKRWIEQIAQKVGVELMD